MQLITSSIAVFRKDLILEIRSRYGLNTILSFVTSSLLVVLFALQADNLNEQARSGLIWIIILFAAMAALPRTFVAETDQGTFDLLRLHFGPIPVFVGKLLYNIGFTSLVSLFTLALYLLLMNMTVSDMSTLLLSVLLGSVGLSSVATILSALVAQSAQRGALFSVLSIPLLIPLILILARTTFAGFYGDPDGSVLNDLMALVGYCGATVTGGSLLFEFVWDD